MLLATAGALSAQDVQEFKPLKKTPVRRARRETNASREARIQRTINATYAHPWEVFGGGGYLRFRSGESTQKNNEVSWAVAVHRYLNPKFAVVGDVRGSFGRAHALKFNDLQQIPNPQINEYTFMGGGNYRFYGKEKLALSIEGLAGAGWGLFSGGAKGLSGTQVGLWQDGVRPAFSVGLNLDYNFYPNLAFRVTPTYVGTTFADATSGTKVQNNMGFNMGVVYRFGSH